MGYSYTAKAGYAMDAMLAILTTAGPVFSPGSPDKSMSNSWKVDGIEYFYERGRENDSGAITGSVYRNNPNNTCHRIGSVLIKPDGVVVRFPSTTKVQRMAAENAGMVEYNRRHPIVYPYSIRRTNTEPLFQVIASSPEPTI